MEDQPRNYTDGFNSGYKLNKYTPELFDKLKDSLNPDIDYDRGLLEGAAQAVLEKEQQRMNELQQLQGDKENEQDIERE
jgi:hypothetical protein